MIIFRFKSSSSSFSLFRIIIIISKYVGPYRGISFLVYLKKYPIFDENGPYIY